MPGDLPEPDNQGYEGNPNYTDQINVLNLMGRSFFEKKQDLFDNIQLLIKNLEGAMTAEYKNGDSIQQIQKSFEEESSRIVAWAFQQDPNYSFSSDDLFKGCEDILESMKNQGESNLVSNTNMTHHNNSESSRAESLMKVSEYVKLSSSERKDRRIEIQQSVQSLFKNKAVFQLKNQQSLRQALEDFLDLGQNKQTKKILEKAFKHIEGNETPSDENIQKFTGEFARYSRSKGKKGVFFEEIVRQLRTLVPKQDLETLKESFVAENVDNTQCFANSAIGALKHFTGFAGKSTFEYLNQVSNDLEKIQHEGHSYSLPNDEVGFQGFRNNTINAWKSLLNPNQKLSAAERGSLIQSIRTEYAKCFDDMPNHE